MAGIYSKFGGGGEAPLFVQKRISPGYNPSLLKAAGTFSFHREEDKGTMSEMMPLLLKGFCFTAFRSGEMGSPRVLSMNWGGGGNGRTNVFLQNFQQLKRTRQVTHIT